MSIGRGQRGGLSGRRGVMGPRVSGFGIATGRVREGVKSHKRARSPR